ncbi:MAG: hypothetical protein RM338_08070 [Nostoc sp. DedQUE12a]|nr:hypothetical protein [Nostoc sp. DedQUE12a]
MIFAALSDETLREHTQLACPTLSFTETLTLSNASRLNGTAVATTL